MRCPQTGCRLVEGVAAGVVICGFIIWRQCAGWEIDDCVDVVDGVVGAVGHRERDTAEVDDWTIADAVPTALPKVIAAASAPTPRAAVVRDKRVGVSSPFTDVLPFVVTASVRGMRSSQEIATTIEEDNGHSPHGGGVVRHRLLGQRI